MSVDNLPDCFGFYGFPVWPGECQKCPVGKFCKQVIVKKKLEFILSKVREVKATLRG